MKRAGATVFPRGSRGIFGLIAAATLLAGTAAAETIYDGMTPNEMQGILQDMGYKAKLETSKTGKPFIATGANGLRFIIFFYNCSDKNNTCTSAQFVASWNTEGKDKADVAEWNRERRFLTAYRLSDGDLAVKMDLNLDGGVTRAYFEDSFRLWSAFLRPFDEYRSSGKL